MPSLGSLWYTMGIRDMTDADLKKINDKLKNAGSEILINPKLAKSINEILPKGIKIELDPQLKSISNDALAKAAEGKVMKVEIAPLITNLRKALKDATVASPPEIEVGVQAVKLRNLISQVLTRQGFMISVSTVAGNFTKTVQQQLNGTTYKVKIHADAAEITRSVQTSLMQVQSRYFGLQVSKDILRNSIDQALMGKPFNIQIAVMQDQARRAVQNALNNARMVGKDDALAYQRLQTGELRAAQTELARLKAAHMGAADAAKAHTTASVSLGGAMGRNITVAGELGSAMASLYSIHAAKEFLSQVIEIGGELEHQKIALQTIYGSESKMESLYGQIKGLARQSPFGVMDLTKNVKQLSAYGVAYNEVYDTAKRLADISAATSVDIGRLILAFGKTKNRTFLDGLEAKQFAYANIPIYDALSKKLTELEGRFVSVKDVMGRISNREIGFDMVKEILWDMTDEGGKFYNMQEKLAGSVKTSWKLVRDNIELMFGEIAESSVGGALKDVAEILQVLTRNWRAMGAVIASAALTFGVYKVAVAASNAMMGQANALALQKATAANKVAAANAIEAASYRTLTQAEDYAILAKSGLAKLNRSLLLSHRALTEAEWDAVIASKAVNNDYILRRIALNRLTQAEIDYLISIKAVTAAEVQTAMNARGLKVSIASLWASVKIGAASAWTSMQNFFTRFRIGMAGLGTSMKTFKFSSLLTWIKTLPSRLYHAEIGVTRLKLAFSGLGRAMASIGAFFLNPITLAMTAIGGLMYVWEKNNEQMEKAKEIGDNIFTKASEGADNLKQKLQEIKPSKGLSDLEMERGIEDMIHTIKDYSPTPLKDINDALVAQDGHLLTIEERYEALRKKVESLNASYSKIADNSISIDIENAIKDTKENWLYDDVNANASDLGKALQKREDAIRKFATKYPEYIRKAATDATNASREFAAATESMNDIQKIEYLIKNLENFSNLRSIPSVSNLLKSRIGTYRLDSGFGIESAMKELESDMQKFADSLSTSAKQKNIDSIKDASEEIKQAYMISIKNWVEGLEVPEEVKVRMYSFYSDLFGLDFETFDIGERLIKIFKEDELAQLGPVIANKLKSGLKLSDSEQAEVDNALYKSYLKAYSKANEYEKKALNNALTTNGVFDSKKARKFLLNIDVTYDWPDWKKELNEQFNGDPQIQTWLKGAADHQSFIKAVQEGFKDAKTTLDKLKPLMLKAGIEFDGKPIYYGAGSKLYGRLNANQKKMIDDYNAVIEEMNAAKKAGDKLGVDPAEEYSKGNKGKKKGSQKDEFAESLKQRFKDIKDAWSEFQKWSKAEGREAAATRIGDSGLFSTLSKDKIPKTIEDYRALVKGLEDELRKAGVKGTAREGLLNDLLKQLLDIDKTVVDEQLKLALDKVSKEAERQLEDWNLFDKIRKATGNKQLAMNIAFGMGVSGETDYVTMVKNQFDEVAKAAKSTLTFDTATPDALTEAPDEVKKAWEKAYDLVQKYRDKEREDVADMVEQYRSTQEEIITLTAEAEEKKRKIRESKNLTPVEKQQITDKIDADLNYEVFRKSGEYLKFFNAILSMTGNEAEKVGQKIKEALDDRLKAGQITTKEYCDEMEKIDKQLEKIRQKQKGFGGLGSFAKGGLQQMFKDRFEQAKSDYNAATQNFDTAKQQFDLFSKEGNEAGMQQAQSAKDTASAMKEGAASAMQGAQGAMSTMAVIDTIVHGINDTVQGIKGSFDLIADMADSLGIDTGADTDWGKAGAFLDAFSQASQHATDAWDSLKSGNVGGVIQGVIGSITSWFTTFNRWHDAKLQAQIEKSKQIVQNIQYAYDAIERRMESYLGNARTMRVEKAEQDARRLEMLNQAPQGSWRERATRRERERLAAREEAYKEGGAYGYQRQLMTEQLAELEKQRQAELDKKDTDSSVVADYENQIDEMRQQILEFSQEVANSLYGIDLKGWASELGDALFDAWKKGEDGAEAFKKKAGEILGDVMNNILKIGLLEPMMQDVSDYLFGTEEERKKNGGKGGVFGTDFELTPDELEGLAGMLMKGMEGVDAYNSALDQLEKILNEKYGLSMKDDEESKSGLSAGIQGITESTADLLASYLNSIRADVSLQTYDYWARLLNDSLPQISVIAQSQLDCQRQIAENTLRNAVAAEAIVKSNDDISRLLVRVTQGGEKFHIQ